MTQCPDNEREPAEAGPDDSVGRSLDLDTAMYVLTSRRRRDALRYLRERGQPVPEGEVITHVTNCERERGVGTVETVSRDLRRIHIPRLVNSPAVERRDGKLHYVGDATIEELLTAVTQSG